MAMVVAVTPGYFRTMGTPMIEGRDFADSDVGGGEAVAIVSEEFARALAPRRLVGRKLKLGWRAEPYDATIIDAVQGVDPHIPVYDVNTLDQRLTDVLARPRFFTTAIIFLACFALLVAAIGTYGAASRTVAQRTHPIGVRIAIATGCAIWIATSRVVRTDPTTALRME